MSCQRLYQILGPLRMTVMKSKHERAHCRVWRTIQRYAKTCKQYYPKMDGRIASGLSFLLRGNPKYAWFIHVIYDHDCEAPLSPLLLVPGARYVTLIRSFFSLICTCTSRHRSRSRYFEGVRSLGRWIRTSNRLASLRSNALTVSTTLRTSLAEIRHCTKIVRFVGNRDNRSFLCMFYQYFAICFWEKSEGSTGLSLH